MKSKILFTCVVALALLSGCIKDEGEDLLIMRQNVCDSTVVTGAGGYMEGVATKDSIVKNSFETIITDNQIQKLNCYEASFCIQRHQYGKKRHQGSRLRLFSHQEFAGNHRQGKLQSISCEERCVAH